MKVVTEPQAQQLVTRASGLGLTLCTVESCTAGALAQTLAGADGASEVFHGSLIVYTKSCKTVLAGVDESLLRERSAVSREVALALASGGLRRILADLSIAITGVAGPAPDEDGNPVGLVYVAVERRGRGAQVEELHLTGSRSEICSAAISRALVVAHRLLEGNEGV